MNPVLEAIRNRRSVRSFDAKPVSDDDLSSILEAATWAPSGMNTQAWHFTAVRSPDALKRLNAIIREAAGRSSDERLKSLGKDPDANFFYKAPAVILASNEEKVPSPWSDCAAGLENSMLAASSLGIGSCWIHIVTHLNGDPEALKLLADLGVPAGHKIYGSIALGYGSASKAPARKPGTTSLV
jgi:nitroreductase